MYSPDGTRLAFVSNRTGNGDLYVLQLDTGALKRITFDDAPSSWMPGRATANTSTSPPPRRMSAA